jgi:hypothetical protein
LYFTMGLQSLKSRLDMVGVGSSSPLGCTNFKSLQADSASK